MPRNLNGVYTLPEAPFENGTVIESSVMNSDLSDIATALTGSLNTLGTSFMTAPLEGSPTASNQSPSFRFADWLGTGFYITSGNIRFAISSVLALDVDEASINWYKSHYFADTVTFLSDVYISGGIATSVSIAGDLTVLGNVAAGGASTLNGLYISNDETGIFLIEDENIPVISLADGAFIYYDRDNKNFVFNINDEIVFESGTTANISHFYGTLGLSEQAVHASASANDAIFYARDNSGTSRVAYVDQNGRETFMGGPGQWELAGESSLTTSVGSVTFNLTKVYSRLVLNVMRLSCNNGTGFLFANISDDAGVTLVSCRSVLANLATDIFTTNGLSVYRSIGSAALNLRAEINRADKTGPKQYFSLSGDTTQEETYYGVGQSASCGAVNTIVVANNVTNMVAGTIQVWGLMAR